MPFESVTDELIEKLLRIPKRVSNAGARPTERDGCERVNYKATATDGSGHRFEIYKRQNIRDGMKNDFSCGINWLSPSGETLILRRYNGSSHPHPNKLEREQLEEACHIHTATERYIRAGKKPEGFAQVTDRYTTVDGALHELVTECNVSGLVTTAEMPELPF